MCSSRTLLALAIAGLLPLGTAQACGPEFPYRLLSDRAGFMTGSVHSIDGGYTAQ